MIPQLSGGGADGSIMTFGDIETQYLANRGVTDIVEAQAQFLSQFGGVISPGDLCVWIHYQASHRALTRPFLAVSSLLVPLASATVPVLPGCNFSSVAPMQPRLLQTIQFLRRSTPPTLFWHALLMLGSTPTKQSLF